MIKEADENSESNLVRLDNVEGLHNLLIKMLPEGSRFLVVYEDPEEDLPCIGYSNLSKRDACYFRYLIEKTIEGM